MTRTLFVVPIAAIAAALVACGGSASEKIHTSAPGGSSGAPVSHPPEDGNPGNPPPPADQEPPPPVATSGELPCDVQAVLQSCGACHGTNLAGGANVHLVTYANLAAPSPMDPTQLEIDRAIARMGDAQRPMPPGGGATQADISTLVAWRAAGMPPASTACGASDAGTSEPPPPPGPTPTVCTSGTYWSSGNNGSSRMNPGLACIACHSQRGAPQFAAAGTLYPTVHEPDLCNGADGNGSYAGASVEITDATGQTVSTSVNSAGNFYFDPSLNLTLPIRAAVHFNGKVREMVTAQNSADCNSCHTEQGTNGAPGRIALP